MQALAEPAQEAAAAAQDDGAATRNDETRRAQRAGERSPSA
jgi:hypothetical protein